jgi:hypothetical protein
MFGIRYWVLQLARDGKRRVIRDKRIALIAACLLPTIALLVMLASAQVMAAPPPPLEASDPQSPISNLPSPTPALRAGASVSSAQSPICFYRDHTLECVSRVSAQSVGPPEDQARALIQTLLAGPSTAERASGLRSALPQAAQLADVSVAGDAITVKLVLPESFLYGRFDALSSDEINEQVIKALDPLEYLRVYHVLAQDPRDPSGAFKPLAYFLFEPPLSRKSEAARSELIVTQTTGALAGKAVYLSAGHGWYWDGYWGEWRTQPRSSTNISFSTCGTPERTYGPCASTI